MASDGKLGWEQGNDSLSRACVDVAWERGMVKQAPGTSYLTYDVYGAIQSEHSEKLCIKTAAWSVLKMLIEDNCEIIGI